MKKLACSQCGEGCDHGPIYIHGRCHPSAPTFSFIVGDVLTVECAQCKKRIVSLKISPESLSNGTITDYFDALAQSN